MRNQRLESFFYEVLRMGGGPEILGSPGKFISSLADVSGGSIERVGAVNLVLKSDALKYFYQFSQDADASGISVVDRVTDYICDGFGMDREWARSLCIDMTHAIEQYQGRSFTRFEESIRPIVVPQPTEDYTPNSAGGYPTEIERQPKYQTEPNGGNQQNNNLIKILCILLVAALLVTLTVIALTIIRGNHDSATPTADPRPAVTVTSEPAPTETATPTPTPDPSDYVREAVGAYLYAFVNDVNAGSYSNMSLAVQPGSGMEQTQRSFLEKRSGDNIVEELRDYSVESITRIDDNTYHASTIESYEIWMSADPPHSTLKQKCTYEVKKQSNGSWKVSDFVGEEQVVERIVLN